MNIPGFNPSSSTPSSPQNCGGTSPFHFHQQQAPTASVVEDHHSITNNNDDDDSNNTHHVGIARLPPHQTLSKGSVQETFEKLLVSSDDRKDIFINKGISGSCLCGGYAPHFYFFFCIALIVGGIALVVLMAQGIVDVAALTGVIYCFLVGIAGAILLTLLGETHYQVDKLEKVFRTVKNFTFFKLWNSYPFCSSPYEIKFEDIDYVTVSGLQDGSFEEDFVEVHPDPEKKELLKRVPVKIARRLAYAKDLKKKEAHPGTAAVDIPAVNTTTTSNNTNTTSSSSPTSSLIEGSDEWKDKILSTNSIH